MAKTKAELLDEAKALGLELDSKLKVAEIQDAIKGVQSEAPVTEDASETEQVVAKAGKRSAKGLKAAEDKQTKIERQHHSSDAEEKAAPVVDKQHKPARPKHERKGKKYKQAYGLVEKDKSYPVKDAVDLAIKTTTTKFDATVELHIRLGVDPKQADQNVRDTVVLPAGTGRDVRVAVFCEADDVAKAKKAGADVAAADEFLEQLEKGNINFDILIATPNNMPKLGKYARILGPKGLMPNPKSGTVTKDVAKAVQEAKAGKVEYRVDSTGIIHVGVGKVSFDSEKLMTNILAVIGSVKSNKPASLKGNFIETIYLTTTMGPSVKVNTTEI